MPKVYFLDLGLRNCLLKNLKPFEEREDKGQLLENALFKEFLKSYDFEEIKFWRTTQKQEIDFIIKEEAAYEAKVNPERFRKSKCKSFFENYPNIKFSLVSFDYPKEKIEKISVVEVWKI